MNNTYKIWIFLKYEQKQTFIESKKKFYKKLQMLFDTLDILP